MKIAKTIFCIIIAIQGANAVTRSERNPSQEEKVTDRSTHFPDWKGKRQRTNSNNQRINRVSGLNSRRQRKDINYYESTTPSSSSSDALQENDNTSTSIQKPNKAKKKRPVGYHTHEEIAKRTAIKYINEGRFKDKREALEQAWSDLREKKRLDSLKRRIRDKNKGIKESFYRRPGRNQKEDVINRKIVRLLGERNNVVRHDTARKLAEEEYARQTREYSASYRLQKANKQLVKDRER